MIPTEGGSVSPEQACPLLLEAQMQFPDGDDDEGTNIFTTPEELQAHIREQAARSQQLSVDVRHQIERFMEALDEDQLDTLRYMIHLAGHQGPSFTLWFEGYISSMMKHRFSVCPACHTNHDQVPAEWTGVTGMEDLTQDAFDLKGAVDQRTPLADLPWSNADGWPEPLVGKENAPSLSEVMSGEAYEQLGKLAPAEVEGQMELVFTMLSPPQTREEYEARKNEEIETPHNGTLLRKQAMILYRLEPYDDMYFYCRDCQMTYVSLEDRMLKRPDECHGCFAKASQG